MAIDGLIVSGIDLIKTNEWIEQSRAYSKQSLPVEREEIATPNKTNQWDYFKSISREIAQQDDIEIGMQIGANYMKELEPLGIISSRNDGSYAYRTKLGWWIVGPIVSKISNKSVKCNYPAAKDVIAGKVALHHFKIDKRLKRSEIGVKEIFKIMFHNDFCEVKQLQLNIIGNIEDLSREDKKMLKILETGAKKNGNHYEVPLSFKDADVKLPNNRNQAIRRINQLKRRFQKDSKFFEEYKRNVGELLEKKYARKSE